MSNELARACAGLAVEVRLQGPWMAWNVALAVLPVGGAVVLYARRHRRTSLWWAGAVAVLLFLPNTPYLVTDLVHLHADLRSAPSHDAAVDGVLPLFAAVVILGFLGYLFCLRLLRRGMRDARVPVARRRLVEAGVHVACAAGIALGRVDRLNSWDVLQPSSLASGLVHLEASPLLVYAALVVLVACTVALDQVVTVTLRHVVRHWPRLRTAPLLRDRPA